MNLIIDIGNTRTKAFLIENGKICETLTVDKFSTSTFQSLFKKHNTIKKAIISTVKNNVEETIYILKEKIDYVINLDHTTQLPIQNLYQTPETLGKDRIAAAVGANLLYPNQKVLVIDAGTAITYDFVNKQDQYCGGFISPGLNMRFKALNQFTDKLPLIRVDEPEDIQGVNTELSIKGGIQYGLEGEIERVIKFFSTSQDELKIILTGGDTKYFEKLLKNYKFVSLEILAIGLNRILEFNYIQ